MPQVPVGLAEVAAGHNRGYDDARVMTSLDA
jgi:hypothetical protein